MSIEEMFVWLGLIWLLERFVKHSSDLVRLA